MRQASNPIKIFKMPLRHAIANGLILSILLSAGLWAGFLVVSELRDACITESREKILNVSGYNFEISETNCDFIAKEDHINVLASKPGQTKQTLIFVYSPGRDPMPAIRSTGPNSIRISIADISSEILRMNNWEGLSIEYDIGVVYHPDNPDGTKE